MSYGRSPSLLEQGAGIALIGAALFAVVALIAGGLSLITGTFFYFAWNHGAVPFIDACGGTVSGISWAVAFWASWFLSLVAASLKGAGGTVNVSS